MKLYYYFFDFFVISVISAVISYIINKLFVHYGINIKQNKEDHSVIRWGSRSKPAIGGVSFFLVLLLATGICTILTYTNNFTFSKEWIGIVLATSLGFAMGLYDDAYHLRPLPKLLIQITCAAILISTGLVVNVTNIFFVDMLITAFWVVGMMNSINMLDNMDGITGSISFIAIFSIFIPVFEFHGLQTQTFILMAVMGSLLGFLYLNWNPSKLYMGDSGSQFLGAFLSGISIMYLWRQEHFQGAYGYMANIILPIIIFIVPITDTTIVTFKRISKGRSPFVGGKDHITHHFVFYALTDRTTAILLSSIALISSIIYNVLFFNIIYWKWYLSMSLLCYIAIISGFIFYFYQQGERKKRIIEHNQSINKHSNLLNKKKTVKNT